MQDRTQITLSIATVCYDSPDEEILSLLRSLIVAINTLRQATSLAPVRLSIIDNSESAKLSLGLFESISQQLENHNIELRLLQGHGNIGYGRAHNLALPQLSSDFHLIINPDVKLEPDSLLQGITYLMENPEVHMASPDAIDEQGHKQHLCKRYPALFTFLARGFFPSWLKKHFHKRLSKFEMHDLVTDYPTTDIPIVSGCFMLCRTDALKEIEGFNEAYFLYFEDFDLSIRMGKIGKLAYLPAMKIEHRGGHAARKGLSHIGMFGRSAIRFYNTHGWRLFAQ